MQSFSDVSCKHHQPVEAIKILINDRLSALFQEIFEKYSLHLRFIKFPLLFILKWNSFTGM